MTATRTRHQKSNIIYESHEHGVIVETREIFLHSHFGESEEDPGIEYRSANRFLKNVRILEHFSNNPIIVHQHSPGGDWNAGMVMYDVIKNSSCSFVFVCHGIAASMGSIVPQAAHDHGYRIVMPNCDWLIHDGSIDTGDMTIRQFNSYHGYIDAMRRHMLEIYTDSCAATGSEFHDMKRNAVKNFIRRKLQAKEDWWFNAEEAVTYGFADGVFGSEGYENIQTIVESL